MVVMNKRSSSLVSIIVPVYNVEAYVSRCIESILNQTYKNLEVVLINDGSTDLSGEILDDFKAKDNRVRVVHKDNGGVSSARNVGLDSATGDFIMFIDSDDWIDKRTVQYMLQVALHEDLDVVTCGMRYVNTRGVSRDVPYDYHPLEQRLVGKAVCYELIKELVYGGGSLGCRLISKKITSGERFIEGMRVSEDQEWLLRILERSRAALYVQKVFYSISVRPGSATTESSVADISDIGIVNQAIISWASENDMSDDEAILNALFVRSRLQYSSGVRAFCDKDDLYDLKKGMIAAYKKTRALHQSEVIKYYTSLLPPGVYRLTRKLMKRAKGENV